MSKFFVFYYAPKAVMEQMQKLSPEQGAEMMKQWFDWRDRCGDGMIDLGGPLLHGQTVTIKGREPSKQNIGSYSILQADNMEGALALLEGHPHLSFAEGCSIEIYEALPAPKM